MAKNSGQYNVSSKGWATLIGSVVLGSGALALFFINQNQSQSNPQFTIDNRSQSKGGEGRVGDININPSLNQRQESNPSANQQPKSSATTAIAPTSTVTSESSNSAAKIDLESPNVKWSLKYPVYKIENDKCILAGTASVILTQAQGGQLSHYTNLNVYGLSTIQGTVTAAGKVNLSISSNDGKYLLTLDGENPKIEANETVIAGKATMLNCQESTFELKK